jgi:hypothetical protein
MKAWSLYHPFVLIDVPGASAPLVDQALCMAAREFCQRSGVWVEWSAPITATPETNRYPFGLTVDQELVRVVRAIRGSTELRVLSYRDVPPDWIDPDSTELVDSLVHLGGAEFLVFPKPTSESIKLQLSFKPSILAASGGDVLFDSFAEEIATGAKARLLMTRSTPFFDPQMAGVHQVAFDRACSLAANADFRQLSPGMRRVKKSAL